MYNHMLDTFIAVADCGALQKASQQLYISPTAIMKQMNALENHLELKLIERTPSGVQLTSAGEIIYRNAKFMIDYSPQIHCGGQGKCLCKRYYLLRRHITAESC